MTKRAAIYARVSTDEQRGNYSIPTQVRDCLRHIQDNGYAIGGDRFVDPETGLDVTANKGTPAFVDDYTSRELSRPALDAALLFLETIGFDVLVVHALDRLARDPYIRRTLEMEFEKRGAVVEFVLGSYDKTPEGEVRKDLDATFGKWENAKRIERTQRGKRGKAQKGIFVGEGKITYGYRADTDAPGGLVIYEAEAEVIRTIFKMFLCENYSIRGITQTLSQKEILNYSGKTKWSRGSVYKILTNETYAGTAYYNKWKSKGGKHLTLRDFSEWIPIPVAPIITRSIFEEAQQKLEENREVKRRKPRLFYLLSGMVVCTKCGYAYCASSDRGNRYYRHSYCMGKWITARKLEPDVWGTIACAIMDINGLREGYQEALKQDEAMRERQQAHLETLERAAIRLEQKRDNLTKAYIDPDLHMSKAEYVKQKAAIENELKEVAEEISEIQADLQSMRTSDELQTLEVFAVEMRQTIEQDIDPDPHEKRRILEMLHVRVLIDPDGKHRVKGWFKPNSNGVLSTTSAMCDTR